MVIHFCTVIARKFLIFVAIQLKEYAFLFWIASQDFGARNDKRRQVKTCLLLLLVTIELAFTINLENVGNNKEKRDFLRSVQMRT